MSEASQGTDKQVLPNRVADFVITSLPDYDPKTEIDHYQKLNAPTFLEADKKFRKALKLAVEKSRLGEQMGVGMAFSAYQLENDENVVVKIYGDENIIPTEETNQEWESFQREHDLIEKYFGRRFVPYTEFIILDENLLYGEAASSGKTYVMVQEKIHGEDYQNESEVLSPKLKEETIEFIKRYEQMMHEENAVINTQFMIDFENKEIKISDTNYLHYFKDVFRHPQIKQFLNSINITSESAQTLDIINALTTSLPQLTELHGKDYNYVMEALDRTQDDYFDDVMNSLDDSDLRSGFEQLTWFLNDFAPSGLHNEFITGIMTNFDISETDLTK